MSEKRYAVKEAFLTLQGEGMHAGTRAVFVRFSGCNVWTGREEDRERDARRGVCAKWCDTNFVGVDGENGGRHTALRLATLVRHLWFGAYEFNEQPRVVFTGGEPSLQIDEELIVEMREIGARVHVETNGSSPLDVPDDWWITLSPKPPMPVVRQRYDEVKVIYPVDGIDPSVYVDMAPHRFVQPLDEKDDVRTCANMQKAAEFVLSNPTWRLSVQTHKVIGVP